MADDPFGWTEKASDQPVRLVLADAGDRRAVQAARLLNGEELAQAVVVGDGPRGGDVGPHELKIAEALDRPVDLDDPLNQAMLLVAAGRFDACVAGAGRPTADVLRSALRLLGVAAGHEAVSSSFFFVLPDGRPLVYGDCGVIPDPDSTQLASIAIASAATFAQLSGLEPRVAMLSFSTKGSADHPRVDKVRQATELVRMQAPGLAVDGELQFDAAWDSAVARAKAPASDVAGAANVFIFPDLDSGNIGYKITERLAGANAYGPLLQGINGVVHDLSRGCSVEDIVSVSTIAAVQVNSRRSQSPR